MPRGHRNTDATFDEYVSPEPNTGCHLWTGHAQEGVGFGYGRFRVNGRRHQAHRYAWERVYGPIPDGLYVCHHCDQPACVNVQHFFLGTNQENQQDASRKGRNAHGERNGGGVKLNSASVREMRALYAQGVSSAELGRRFGVSQQLASRIVHRGIWRHVL